MPSTDTPHLYLKMHPFHLSVSDAEKLVLHLLKKQNPTTNNQEWKRSKEIHIRNSEGQIVETKTFKGLVAEARATGTVWKLRNIVDANDPLFGGRHAVGVSENMKLGQTWGHYKADVQGPGGFYLVELELTEDILHYRGLACQRSSLTDFSRLGRAHRAYLLCCIALIEAFLNVDITVRKNNGSLTDEDASKWIRSSLEHRVEIWVDRNCPPGSMQPIKQTLAWAHFKELRVARNAVTHTSEPFFGIEVRSLMRELNLVREGVGGMLRELRAKQGLDALGFMERLESAPPVNFITAFKRK